MHCLYSSPRTGSKFYMENMCKELNVYSLGECFSPFLADKYIQKSSEIINKKFEQPLTKIDSLECIEHNFEIVKETKPVFKIMGWHIFLIPDLFDFINENYTVVCLQRRNIFDQFKSYIIATETNNWHNNTVESTTVLAKYDVYCRIASARYVYEHTWQKFNNKLQVFSEDFIETKDTNIEISNLTELEDWHNNFQSYYKICNEEMIQRIISYWQV